VRSHPIFGIEFLGGSVGSGSSCLQICVSLIDIYSLGGGQWCKDRLTFHGMGDIDIAEWSCVLKLELECL